MEIISALLGDAAPTTFAGEYLRIDNVTCVPGPYS